MTDGIHIVRKLRKNKPAIFYVYAWRGGPKIHQCEGIRPKKTRDLQDLAAEARRKKHETGRGDLAELIAAMRASPEWTALADSTRANWNTWYARIQGKFGTVPLAVFNDRKMRSDLLDWRDTFAATPRAADVMIEAFSRLLSFGFDRGRLSSNILAGTTRLYESDRSDLIWEAKHFEQFATAASVEVQEAVDLAACTGLRRGDLVKLPRSAIGEHAIIWQTNKSRGKRRVVIPIIPETRAVIDRIDARFEAEMASRIPSRRFPRPETVLFNSKWKPWTAMGFGSRFNDAKVESGIDLHLHDLRGTFATRCMIAGLTDDEIANILGWGLNEVAAIRVKYVDQARVVVAIGERIARASVKSV